MIYSKHVYVEQCRLRLSLEDDKGTYCKIIDRTKEDILNDIVGGILIPIKVNGECWKQYVIQFS